MNESAGLGLTSLPPLSRYLTPHTTKPLAINELNVNFRSEWKAVRQRVIHSALVAR